MAIKIKNFTIIDDDRNIIDAGITTVTSLSIGSTEVITSTRELVNVTGLNVSGIVTASEYYLGQTPLIAGVGISSNFARVSTGITDFNFVGAAVTLSGLTTATITIPRTLIVGRRDAPYAEINIVGGGMDFGLRDGSVVTLSA